MDNVLLFQKLKKAIIFNVYHNN